MRIAACLTQVLIFGNPRASTPLMHAQQTISLDLPLESLEPAVHDCVKRGSRYIYLMPKQERPKAPPPAR